MTMQTLTLPDFLDTCIAVDEDSRSLTDLAEALRLSGNPSLADYLVDTRRRELAEAAAKRRIWKRHRECGTGYGYCDDGGHGWGGDLGLGCAELADLASIYADRPGYREEWSA